MHQPMRLRLAASIALCCVLLRAAQGADKYTDENRPYEFGFKIDGEQHRHESKDKDGIIMGEFGFVTADDVYHVTVYATDKEGRFKILSMKNIHLKSSSASSSTPTSARQGHALALPPAQPASVQASVVPQQPFKQVGAPTSPQIRPFAAQAPASQGAFAPQPGKPNKPLSIEPPGKSCSSCSLPTTTTRAPPPAYNQVADNNNYNSPNQFGAPGVSPQNQQAFPPSSPGQQNIAQGGPIGSSYSPQGGQQNYSPGQQNIPQQFAPGGAPSFAPQPGQTPQNYLNSSSDFQKPYAPSTSAQSGGGSFPPAGQTQGGAKTQAGLDQTNTGEQNRLFAGNNNPYAGAGPRGSATTVPDAGNYANRNGQQVVSPGQSSYPQGTPGQSSYPHGTSGQSSYPQGTPGQSSYPQGTPGQSSYPQGAPGQSSYPQGSPRQGSYPQGGAGERTAKQYNGPRQQFDSQLGPNGSQGPGAAQGQRGPSKPTLFSAQMQIVDKNTDIYALGPNEQKGLPPGLAQSDVTNLLYTFNYTVGFHGHFEEGYTNGVKKGYYFVTGRNGVRTRIDYVADDTGFHPTVSQEVLDLLSEDVPKPETEKDEKYGLKGYEFKWLYYPVESKN